MNVSQLPYLTTSLPGVGGQIKMMPEDFYVEEVPRYLPSGSGHHVYLQFEKIGMTTMAAINRIAQSLAISPNQIGYAGLKDAQAVTRQTISIAGVEPERISALSLSDIKVISVDRHSNKLKMGHLAGNKFNIRIREIETSALAQVEPILTQLQQQGVPNYFGEQRFGVRGNSHRLGMALVKKDLNWFLSELLGRPDSQEVEQAQDARQAFDEGNLTEALALWPKFLYAERSVLRRLVETGQPAKAVQALDKRLKRLFVSAYQADLFNQLLTKRIMTLDTLELGDVAYIHRNGAGFVVDDPVQEQKRANRFEISPAGPLFGKKCLSATGKPGLREAQLLAEVGIKPADFDVPGTRLRGGRRPYRIPIAAADVRWEEGLVLSFVLPPGSYATMVLREVMKLEQGSLSTSEVYTSEP